MPQAPPVSSSPTIMSVSGPASGRRCSWIKRYAKSEAVSPPRMSLTPRPRIFPSRISPPYGGNDQSAGSSGREVVEMAVEDEARMLAPPALRRDEAHDAGPRLESLDGEAGAPEIPA